MVVQVVEHTPFPRFTPGRSALPKTRPLKPFQAASFAIVRARPEFVMTRPLIVIFTAILQSGGNGVRCLRRYS